jgi:hypothetical protein
MILIRLTYTTGNRNAYSYNLEGLGLLVRLIFSKFCKS